MVTGEEFLSEIWRGRGEPYTRKSEEGNLPQMYSRSGYDIIVPTDENNCDWIMLFNIFNESEKNILIVSPI